MNVVSGDLLGLPLDIPGLLSSLRPPSPTDPRFTTFTPPGPDDLRSPCPALNALANHNFLPKSGQNITIPTLVSALSTALNIAPELTVALGGAALASSPNPSSGAFTLADLVLIEHDASMSRQDATFGNPQPFHAPSWAQYMSSFKGKTLADVPTASRAKFTRYNDSKTHNPDFKYGAKEFVLSYGEVALYLQALGGPVSGRPRMEWVRVLFEQERLPWAIGWRPSAAPVTLASVGGMIVRLVAAAPEGVPELSGVVVDTYKSSLVAVAGGSGVLSKLTEGLSTVLGL